MTTSKKVRVMEAILAVLEQYETYCLDNEAELAVLHNKLSEAVLKEIEEK